MRFTEGKPPETQYATRPGARALKREVVLGRRGCQLAAVKSCVTDRVVQLLQSILPNAGAPIHTQRVLARTNMNKCLAV
jgi:hypothetical protein